MALAVDLPALQRRGIARGSHPTGGHALDPGGGGSGGGSRTKFFEAMAAGLPIVTTPAGIEGIKAKNGQEVLIGKTHRQLIRLTLKLIKDRRLSRRLAIKEKKLVSQEYSWQGSAEELEKIYQEANNSIPIGNIVQSMNIIGEKTYA